MEPLQKFNIPKIKGVTHREGHIQKVSLSSRDSIILLEDIKKCCLDITYCDQIEVLEILMIYNSELNKSYTAKKSEIRGRSNVSFKEDYGFLCHRIPMRDIAKCGLSIGNITFNGLGESRCGIYLSRYFDVELESSFFVDVKEIFIFKYIAGKSKSVKISFNNNLEPTPNFDSHVSSVPPNVSDSLYTQTNRSKIYLYEYTDDCVPAKYPRHCLPYAVLKVRKLPKCLRTNGLKSKPLTYSSTLTTKDVSQTCPPVKKKKKKKSSKDPSTSFKISLEKSSTLTDGLESPTNKVPKPYQPLLPPEPSGISQSDKNAKNTENNTNATKFSQKCVDPRLRALNSIPQNPFPSALQEASCASSLNSSSWSGYKHQTPCKPIVSCLKTNSKSESKKIKEKKKISLSDYKKKKEETNSDCTESDLATTAEKQNSSEGNVPSSDHLNQSKFESVDVSQRNGLELTSHPALAILNEDSNQSRLCPAPVAQIHDSNIDNVLTHSPLLSCLKKGDSQSKLCSAEESKDGKEKCDVLLSSRLNNGSSKAKVCTTILAKKQNSEVCVTTCAPSLDHLNQSNFDSACVPQRQGSTDSITAISQPSIVIISQTQDYKGLSHKLCSADEAARLESKESKEATDISLSNHSSKAKIYPANAAKKQESESVEVIVATSSSQLGPNQSKPNTTQGNIPKVLTKDTLASDSPTEVRPDYLLAVNLTVCTDIDPLTETEIPSPSIYLSSDDDDEEDEEYSSWSYYEDSSDESLPSIPCQSRSCTPTDSCRSVFSPIDAFPPSPSDNYFLASPSIDPCPLSSQLPLCQSSQCPSPTSCGSKQHSSEYKPSSSSISAQPSNIPPTPSSDVTSATQSPYVAPTPASDVTSATQSPYVRPTPPSDATSATQTLYVRPTPASDVTSATQSPYVRPTPASHVTSATQSPYVRPTPASDVTSATQSPYVRPTPASNVTSATQSPYVRPTPAFDVTSATQSPYVRPTPASDVTSATQSSYVRRTSTPDVTSAKQSPYVRPTPASHVTSATQSPYVRPTPASDVTSATQSPYVRPTPASNVTSATQSPYVRPTPAFDVTSATQSPYVRPTPASDVTSATQSSYVRRTSTPDVTSATQTLYVGPTPASDVTSAKQSPYVRPTPTSDITSAKQSPYVRPTPASDVTSATQSPYVRPTPASDVTSATQSPYVRPTPASNVTSATQSPYVRPTPAFDVTSATQSPYVRPTPASDVTSATQSSYVRRTSTPDVTSATQTLYVGPTPASDVTSAKQSPYVRPTPTSDITSAKQSPYVRPTPASDVTSATQSPYVRPTPASDVTLATQSPYVRSTPASDVTSATQTLYVRPTSASDVTSATQSSYVRLTPASDVTSATQSPYVRPTPASNVTSATQSPYVRPTPAFDVTSATQSPYVRPTPASDVTSATQSSYVRRTSTPDVTSATQTLYVGPTPASDVTSAKQSPYVRPTPTSDITSAKQSPYVRPTPASDVTSATQSPYVRPTPASDVTLATQSPYVRSTPASDVTSATQTLYVRPTSASDVTSATQSSYVRLTPASDVTSATQSPYVRPTPASDVTSATQSSYDRPTPPSDITLATQSPYVRPTLASDVTLTRQTSYVGPTPASDVTSATQTLYVRPTPAPDFISASPSPYVRPTLVSDVTSATQSPYVRPTPASDVTLATQSPYVRPTLASDVTSVLPSSASDQHCQNKPSIYNDPIATIPSPKISSHIDTPPSEAPPCLNLQLPPSGPITANNITSSLPTLPSSYPTKTLPSQNIPSFSELLDILKTVSKNEALPPSGSVAVSTSHCTPPVLDSPSQNITNAADSISVSLYQVPPSTAPIATNLTRSSSKASVLKPILPLMNSHINVSSPVSHSFQPPSNSLVHESSVSQPTVPLSFHQFTQSAVSYPTQPAPAFYPTIKYSPFCPSHLSSISVPVFPHMQKTHNPIPILKSHPYFYFVPQTASSPIPIAEPSSKVQTVISTPSQVQMVPVSTSTLYGGTPSPQVTLTALSSQPATSLSSNPEAYLPSQPTRLLPSQSTTSLPSQPTRVLPLESMTLLPSQSTTSSPSQPTRALPSQSITLLRSQSTTSSPSQSTRVLPPLSTASSPSHPMTSLPSQPISLSPQDATSCSQDLDNIIKSYNDPICISSGGEDMDEPSQKNIKLIEIQANNLKKKMKDSWSKNERKHIEELDPKIEKLVQHIAQFSNSTVNASLIKSKIHEKFKSQCFYESIVKSTKLKDAVPSKCDDYYKYRCPSPAQTDYVVNRLTGKQVTTSDCIIISGSSSNVSCCDVDVHSECLAVNSSTTPSSDLDENSGYISISDTDSTPGHVTQSRSTASSIASFTSTDRNHFIKKLYQEKTTENQNQSAKHDTSPEAHSSGLCVQHSESYLTNAPLEALHLAKDTILKEIHLLEATYLSQEENMDNGQECPLSDTTEDTLHPPVSSLETVKDIFSQKKAKINNSRTIQKSNGSLLVQCVNDSLDALLEIDYSTPEQSESLKNKKHELHDAYGHNSDSNSLFLNASTFDSDLRVTVLGPDSPNTDCMPSRKVNKKRKWSQADEKQSLKQKRTKLVSVVSNEHLAIKKQMTKNKYFMKKGDNKKSSTDIDKSKSIIAGTTRSSSLERSKNNISLDSHEKKSLLNKPDKTNVNDSIEIAKEDSLVDETDTSSSVERTRESMSVEKAKIKSSFKRSIITSPSSKTTRTLKLDNKKNAYDLTNTSSKTRITSPLKSGNKRIYTPHDCRSFKFQPSHRSASMSPNRSFKHWSSRRSLKSRSPKRKKNFIDSEKSSKSSVEKTLPDVQHSLSQPHKTVHKKSIVDELLNIYNQPPSQSGSASSLHKSSDLDFYIPRKETSVKGQDLTVKMFVFLQIGFLFQEDSPCAIPFPMSTILNSQDLNPQQQKNMGDEIMKACSVWFDLPSNAFVGRNFIYDIPLSMADRSHVEKFSTQQFYLESKLIGQCHSFLMLEEKDGTLSGDTLEQVLQGFEKKRIKILDLISDIENIAQKLKDNSDPLTTPELTQQVLQLESELTSAVAEYTSSQSHTSNTLKLLILDTLPDLTKVPLLGFTFKSPSLKLMDSHLQNIKHSFEVVTKDFIQTFHSVNFGHAHYPVPEQLLLESEVEELYAKRSCCFILSASIPPQDFKTLFQLRCKIESILKTASDSSDSKKDELVQLTNERAKLLQRYVGHQSSTRKDKLEVLFNNFLITQNYIKKIIGADGLVQMPLFNSLLKATENHFKLLEEAMEKKKPS
ncbi:serine-rich adhesin for platelets [Biomphalaria pfeifferi]|uniref:Serine-rich adhesin for platelets n=1 Tax=Biomphalaria pfeifferi TaxID=112525 RepID=A0AAD8B757_BIOPF|nr:serine-rich adhesin for platelets [Biomphalaria pfeifferi]